MANPNWVKGVSGNPAGRPRIASEIRALAKENAEEAFKTILDLMANGEPAVRMSAAKEVLKIAGCVMPPEVDAVPGVSAMTLSASPEDLERIARDSDA